MAQPFIGEIRIMSFGFPPKGWALCDGQLIPINQNQALFSLLGTYYGGDGRVNFALPNLQGRTPIHRSSGHAQGERGGEQAHTLTIAEVPTHTHMLNAAAPPATDNRVSTPVNNLLAPQEANPYGNAVSPIVSMSPTAVTNVGGSQAHPNVQPFVTLTFCIAMQSGSIFPSQ
jgi:microcystin-dependent protein